MPQDLNRRQFLATTALSLCGAGLANAKSGQLKTSLNAYSFNKMLNDNIKALNFPRPRCRAR